MIVYKNISKLKEMNIDGTSALADNSNGIAPKKQKQTVNDAMASSKSSNVLKPGDFYYMTGDNKAIKVYHYQDGSYGYPNENGTVTKINPKNVKQVPAQGATASKATAATSGQVLKMFKDGDLKSRLSLRNKPFSKIYLSGGNIVVESLDHKTQGLCESLDIDIPDYLLKMKEEKYTAPLGATDLNFLLSDEIQAALKNAGKEVYTIDCSSGKPQFLDGNGKPIDINQVTSNAASQAVNMQQKMSKNDLAQITQTVINTLNGKLSSYKDGDGNSYKITWEINNNAFDPKTLSESLMKEGIKDFFRKTGQKVGDIVGTQASAQRKMTNASVAAPFGIKATITDAKTGDTITDKEVIKSLYGQISKVLKSSLGNKCTITSTDVNGKQYQTQCIIQVQPDVKNDTFMFKTQKNVGVVQDAEAVQNAQETSNKKTQKLQNKIDNINTKQKNKAAKYSNQVASKTNTHNKKKSTVNFAPTAHMTSTTPTIF